MTPEEVEQIRARAYRALHWSPWSKAAIPSAFAKTAKEDCIALCDTLTTALEEIERLTACLKRANDSAEHFEREWYLRGDENERLCTVAAQEDTKRLDWLVGNRALGAFIVRQKEFPELHERLLQISFDLDLLAAEIDEALNP